MLKPSFAVLKCLVLFLIFAAFSARAVDPDKKTMPIGLAPEERQRGGLTPGTPTKAPEGPIHSLGEWEESEAVMTLWVNQPYVKALASRGKVKLFADGPSEEEWWKKWLMSASIDSKSISFFTIPTNSIWIRDFGPWPVIDGKGHYGLLHNTYNRPRPLDNLVAGKIAMILKVPLYDAGLVHTGGNYYSDGVGNAFSSTLVYSENSKLSKTVVDSKMKEYLGIERYSTSPLAPGMTIEHLDTFGKLVAPDTWVFSRFPEGSRYKSDSERMVSMLAKLRSPYGTPYKIFRLDMFDSATGFDSHYRAYLNSFISNHALYFPMYGEASDAEAKRVYQEALPGYEIVGVDSMGTEWGDSVHCRSRNLIRRNTLFVFPRVVAMTPQPVIEADIIPTSGYLLASVPTISYRLNGGAEIKTSMISDLGGFKYRATLPSLSSGTKVSLFILAKDTYGITKRAPAYAPMTIDFEIP